jgi:dolichyl-phosphate-mannose--protein O-mannosyl transferase
VTRKQRYLTYSSTALAVTIFILSYTAKIILDYRGTTTHDKTGVLFHVWSMVVLVFVSSILAIWFDKKAEELEE